MVAKAKLVLDAAVRVAEEGQRIARQQQEDAEAGVKHMGPAVTRPVILKSVEPKISEEARKDRVSGNVLLTLLVDEQGLPQDVKVARGAGHDLDEKSIEAVKQYRFKPAMENGVPVKVRLNIEVNFQIF